ncbi:DNA gyrase inhibitor GyrI [Parabacteroides sp. PF5-5]|uniref:AraC family transcriptional regulator n=1 Tax=unclassified Parabacteroides TaxID=2649774 RepID=UPI002475C908|nr:MULTISPECIES: GyrI-like domain-containing protein [unclassified Parabacteroides]MDH6305171.1 DNA gyrase inhibitor GyrI [Parabacteroides sp. PH5-39]MDH6316521.1 DNA gyrase inhibitor GyrI [Parabacteroides sp. PF5-13]MDH6320031.1 DNA gyrase inhibitor GyrI [Parabacteroides sp. PH5-13]MDH6323736.1 DNA gyrase inhibitor GyrI [Parabacteroides sp. PH5-8]MDH6327708.1 DNA gyrase inhibitor GyrI [Parabacteroides sp. PH5-41]
MKVNSTEIKNLEPIKTIAIPHVGEYSGIAGAFDKLAAWAGANNLWAASPKMVGLYQDDPTNTPHDQLRSKACLEDLSDIELGEGMERYTISGGKYFVMQVEVMMSEYEEAWQKAYAAAFNEKGCECDLRDHYELYLGCVDGTQGVDAPWIVELRIPVK